ncbi:LysR family transcriptional regulator [Cupriavidus necator]|uniref:LysR family transcriptional regulator n=1 Tax=Cupriavidus necator TaxID=106590 RepID=UPI00148FA8FA|nr:LysR family transcriptional regulator [Cupriavidus necator]NOV24294.1 LysR family transcriptional regulator [Cupriavidus necator]
MAHHIDIVTLRLFIAVCEEGNIARAADREAIVASAVSRRIAAVEEDVGTALLVRGRRGIKPTAAGETMLRQAREVLRAMDRLSAELSDFGSGVRSHVRVVAAPAVIAGNLAEDLGAFLEASPSVGISTDERTSPEVVQAVREGAAEVGILWGAVDLSNFEVEPYRRDHLCLSLRPEHALARRETVRFEEVIDQLSIVVAPGGMLDTMLRREATRLSRTLSYRMEVSSLDVAMRFVAAGLGTAVLPREGALGHSKETFPGVRAIVRRLG